MTEPTVTKPAETDEQGTARQTWKRRGRTNPNGLRLVELSPSYRGDRRGAETPGFAKSSEAKAISARPLAA